MFLKALSVVGALVVALVLVIAFLPGGYSVTRSAVIAAPAEQVFPLVNNFHNWESWSPWAKLDPEMELTFHGPDAGEGASYEWSGNNNVGQGSMQIVESVPPQRIVIDLRFLKPMEASSITTFSFEPQGEHTRVTWNMKGENNFIGKAFGLFMNMDKMIGKDFEKGLAALEMAATNP